MLAARQVLCVVTALALGTSVATLAQSPAATKAYPWDLRPKKCLLEQARMTPSCREPESWIDFVESVRRIQILLADPDSELLERAAAEVALTEARFDTGQYLFEAWYLATRSQLATPDPQTTKYIEQWSSNRAASSPALLTQALALFGEAWSVRGQGVAATVSPEAWMLFNQKLQLADSTLESAAQNLKNSGPWHLLKVQISFDSSEMRGRRLDILDKAASAWPDSTMLYEAPMSRSQPKWGGSFALMDGIARLAANKAKTRTSASMYALVYERAFRGNSQYSLRESDIDWKMAKRGFQELQSAGTNPNWLWKNFAQLACQMRDRDEARRLYQLNDSLNRIAESNTPDACRVFAASN